MKLLQRILFTLALLFGFSQAQAVTYYVCGCNTGSDGACVAGSNSNTSTQAQNPATPWLSFGGWGSGKTWANLAAGDRVAFCRGGAISNTSTQGTFANSNSTEANPIVMTDYTPSWCVGGCTSTKPKIMDPAARTSGTYINFSDQNTHTSYQGYVVENLEFVGTGAGGTNTLIAIQSQDLISHATIRNNLFTSIAIAINVATAENGSTHWQVYSNTVNGAGNGFLFSGTPVLIERNTLINCAQETGGLEGHCLYLGGTGYRATVRYNTITGAASTQGRDGNNAIVVHGTHDLVDISYNIITESLAAIGTNHVSWAISAKPGYTNSWTEIGVHLRIVGNKIVDPSGYGIALQSVPYSIIANNTIIFTSTTQLYALACIAAQISGPKTSTSYDMQGHWTVNNTCYVSGNPASGFIGYDMQGTESVKDTSTAHYFVNNVVVFPGSTATNTRYCYRPYWASGSFTLWSSNSCYLGSGAGTKQWSPSNATAPAGFTTGDDCCATDPGLTAPTSGNNWSTIPTSGSSSVVGTGAASVTSVVILDINGKKRSTSAPTRGAEEYNGGAVPIAEPTGIR